ncbi:MAG: hypothetical protein AB7O91_09795 [Sphingomonas sp.]
MKISVVAAAIGIFSAAAAIAAPPPVVSHSPQVAVSVARIDGRDAVRIEHNNDQNAAWGVAATGIEMRDGVIEVEVKSELSPAAPEGSRGFVGIAFRTQPDLVTYEAMYVRPTNGRAEEQIRRNRSTQYVSHPQYPWYRLRQEAPGQYESYVDLEIGVWTRLRIEVSGTRARLYVNNAAQPALVVNDLRHGAERGGGVALWIGSGTIAHFANLTVRPRTSS